MFLEKYGIIGHTLEYHINELSVRLQSVTITTSTILVFCKGHKEKHNIGVLFKNFFLMINNYKFKFKKISAYSWDLFHILHESC